MVFTGYYHKFLDGYSQIEVSLTSLTKKDASVKWTTVCQWAFDRLSEALMKIALFIMWYTEGISFWIQMPAIKTYKPC